MTTTDNAGSGAPQSRLAICTALPKELAACRLILDFSTPVNSDSADDGNQYWCGTLPSRAGGMPHQVLLTSLAKMGNNVAATAVTNLVRSFPSVEYILMVGIAGGVPDPQDPAVHVRLGDVVVSNEKGVLQYDNVKMTSNRIEIRDNSPKPAAALIAAAKALESDFDLGFHPWEVHLRKAIHLPSFHRPPPEADALYDAQDQSKMIPHPMDSWRDRHPTSPRIHLAAIGSANTLLKNAALRDWLRDKHGVRAIEMEGSGTADAAWSARRDYLVIRGICDYCDTHKNDVWQHYAALVAAAYARALIENLPHHPPRRQSEANLFKNQEMPVSQPLRLVAKRTEQNVEAAPIPMFQADVDAFRSIPFDLGTVWGLDRGSFIGLLVGPPGENLRNELRYAERVLDEAQASSEALPCRLPTRWWIEVNPDRYPSGPQNAAQLGQSAVNTDDLPEDGFGADVLPGIMMEVLADTAERRMDMVVQRCHSLMNRVFAATNPAIIVYITGSDIATTNRCAAKLHERLKGLTVPVESMTLCRHRRLEKAAGETTQVSRSATSGFHLFCWLWDATKDHAFWHREQHRYPAVASMLHTLESSFSHPDQPITADLAHDVTIDVDDLIKDNQPFNCQFLSLVASRLPDRLSALVHAYAQSHWPTARRESLIVASQAGLSADIDTLLDAWVAGSRLKPECFPRGRELIPDPNQQPFVNSLALAVLRQYDSEPEVVRDILARLPHNLSMICRLRFKEISLNDFLKEASPEEYLLAARAGVEMSFSIAPYAHRHGIWWLLMALPLHHDRVVELLRLPKEDRAVLGLVTATEWDAMCGDEGLERRIVEYRRGRPVYRRS